MYYTRASINTSVVLTQRNRKYNLRQGLNSKVLRLQRQYFYINKKLGMMEIFKNRNMQYYESIFFNWLSDKWKRHLFISNYSLYQRYKISKKTKLGWEYSVPQTPNRNDFIDFFIIYRKWLDFRTKMSTFFSPTPFFIKEWPGFFL